MPDQGSTALGTDDGRTRLLRRLSIGVPALVMFVAGVWGLGRPSMFGSEAEAYWASRLSPGSLIHLLDHVDAVHGTYYSSLHLWLLIDASPTWMRALSVLAATGAVAMTSVLAHRLSGSTRVGLIAGLLLALLPSVSRWGQSGRPYAVVMFAVTVLVWTLLRALEQSGRWRRWLAFGAATAVCGYLHEMTLLLVPAFAVTLIFSRVPGAAVRRWLITTAAAVVVIVPLLMISARESAAIAHLRPPGRLVVLDAFHQYFGVSDLVAWIVAIAAAIGTVTSLVGRTRGRVSPAALAAPLLAVPATLLFVESRVGKPLYDNRYVLYGAVGAAILAAVGLDRVGTALVAGVRGNTRRTVLIAVPSLAVCVLAAVVQWPTQRAMRTPDGHAENYRASSAFLGVHARRGDGVVFTSGVAHSAQLGYPNGFRGLIDVAQKQSPEQAGTFSGTPVPDASVRAAMIAFPRLWAIGPYNARRPPRVERALLAVLRTDYRPVLVARFAGVNDVLYVRRTRG